MRPLTSESSSPSSLADTRASFAARSEAPIRTPARTPIRPAPRSPAESRPTRPRRVRGALLPLALSLPLFVAACGDGDGSVDPDTGNTAPTTSVFADSDAFTERFGTRTGRDTAPTVDAATSAALVDAVNDFSLKLHRAAAGAEPASGVVSSGFGAATALSLALAGTSDGTRDALANLLGVDALDEPSVHAGLNALSLALASRANDDLVLRSANRVFVRPGLPLVPAFLDTATGDYGAPLTEADFAGATDEVTRLVNDWVSESTDGFIPSIVDRFDPGTALALLNAIFLDATWQDAYEDLGTVDFAGLDASTRAVPAFGGRADLPRLDDAGVRGVELPYAGGELAMLILVPDDLAAFESTLDTARLQGLVDALAPRDTLLRVPKWEDELELDLAALLAPLGLPPSPWDFGRLIDEPAAALDVLVKQKARIEVDENGTRAAAVTGVVGVTSAPVGEPEPFVVDRPFLYVLRDRASGVVLFTGRVISPGDA